MKKISLKKIAYIMAGITLTLTLVLVVHIYPVTRPDYKKEQERVMASIDFKQDIAPDDAEKLLRGYICKKVLTMCCATTGLKIMCLTNFI